jgi:hypothetical protein
LRRVSRIDARRCQTLQMVISSARTDYVNSLIAALEAVLDEWQQNAIFLLVVVEERADMTDVAQLTTGQEQ